MAPDSARRPLQTVPSGRVTDAEGMGLPAVDVSVRDASSGPLKSAIGTVTVIDGRFRLDLSGRRLGAGETGRTDVEVALSEDFTMGGLAYYAEAPPPWSSWGWLRRALRFWRPRKSPRRRARVGCRAVRLLDAGPRRQRAGVCRYRDTIRPALRKTVSWKSPRDP